MSKAIPIHGGRFKRVFSQKQLGELIRYLKEIDLRFFGMTKVQCKRLVYEFAEMKGIDHPFNRETKMAGDEWLANFMKIFRFNVRPNMTVQSSRSTICSQLEIDTFFRILSYLRKRYTFPPDKIYHADEICISAVPNDLTRFQTSTQLKGKGTGRMLVETRDNVTLVCCASATGSYIPPMIVFPRDKMIPGFLRGLPCGSIGYTSEKGLINSELFMTFLKHFVQHSQPSEKSPALLLIDNYISYISIEALIFCKNSNVVIVGFPPQSRQKLQPLDLSFFGPLKVCYSHACDGFSDAYPRVKLTVDNVGEVFRTAYCRIAIPINAIKGFEMSGIEPFEPYLFCTRRTFDSPDTDIASILDPPDHDSETDITAEGDSDIEIVSWSEDVKTAQLQAENTPFSSPDKKDTLEGTAKGNGESIVCLRCGGLFPGKVWVQCHECRQWWHLNCPGFSSAMHCDRCKDIVILK